MKKGHKLKTIEEYWADNQEVLEEAGYTEDTFRANMENLMNTNGVRTSGAWKIFMHKEEFTDPTVRGAENMVNAIKDQDDYDDFRKQVQGWSKKLDWTKFKFNNGHYEYTNTKGDTYVFTLVMGSKGSQYWEWRLA